MRILLDTGILIALLVPIDQDHSRIVKKFAEFERERARLVVTDYVIDELLTRVLYDAGAKVAQFATQAVSELLGKNKLELYSIDRFLFAETLQEYKKLCEKNFSFTDASTLVAYQRGNFDELCTLDSNFRKVKVKLSKI